MSIAYKGFIFDLDGTIYRGEELIPGAKGVIERIREEGGKCIFISNKPIDSRENYSKKLNRL